MPYAPSGSNRNKPTKPTIKKNTETLIGASKEFDLEINTEKTKYMLLSRHQNAGQSHDIKLADRCFGNLAQFRYLGTTITNQNFIQEEVKRIFNSGNACYHSVQNLLPSRLLSKDIQISIYKTIILHVVLYGCETWSLTFNLVPRSRMLKQYLHPQ
jgi:hypothetical protein